MTPRNRILGLLGAFLLLGLAYAAFFTEWLRPEPIQIASQVRASILKPNFGRNPKAVRITNTAPSGATIVTVKTNELDAATQARRVRLPNWGEIDQGPGGAANVTFSLDDAYVLTALRVEDVPSDGSQPSILWQLAGRSTPTRSLLYGRAPAGMQNVGPGAAPQPLTPGAPYRLILEAGRRRGTHAFRTLPAAQ